MAWRIDMKLLLGSFLFYTLQLAAVVLFITMACLLIVVIS